MKSIASIALSLAVLVLSSLSASAQNCTTFTAPVGDSSNKCASTAFVQGSGGNLSAFCPVTGVDVRTCLQTAIDATPTGGILNVSHAGYLLSDFVTINHSMRINCGGNPGTSAFVNPTFTSTSLGNTMFNVETDNFVMDGCGLSRAGGPTTGTAILLGSDLVTLTSVCSITNGLTLLTCTGANFTAGDVGDNIIVIGAGAGGIPLITTIGSLVGPTQINTALAASTTVVNNTARYGKSWFGNKILNSTFANHGIGLHIQSGQQWEVAGNYFYTTENMRVENATSPDSGDSMASNNFFVSYDNTNGYGIQQISGGGLKLSNNKFLGGKYNLYLNWSVNLSGHLVVTGGSMENCGTSSIYVNTAASFNTVQITGNVIDCGSPNISIDNTSASALQGLTIVGNTFQGGGGTAISVGKVNSFTIDGNTIDNGAVNPAIAILSNAQNGYVNTAGTIAASVTITNASATTVIDDMVGMGAANLPATIANGSRIYVTNGAPGTAPCTGASTGATAIRQNGVWRCMADSYTGTGNYVLANSPTLVTPTLGVATATSINKVAITAPATAATLTIANGKTLTASNTLTFTGTDGSSAAFGAGGTVAYTGGTLAQFAATTSAQLAGVISDETGSGALAFATSPTFVTPVLGVASATTLAVGTTTTPVTFHVRTGVDHNMEVSNTAGGTSIQELNNARAAYASLSFDADPLIFNRAGVAKLTIDSSGNTFNSSVVIISDTTTATSVTTGSLQVAGGVSIRKRLFMDGLTADTASTDNSVCHNTSTNEIMTGTGAAGICLGTSSARYKRNIIDAHVGLDEIMRLRPVNFYYLPGRGGPQLQYGFVAEEVVDAIPSIVGLDRDAEPTTVDMMAMVPILTKAMQELKSEVDDLRNRNAHRRAGYRPRASVGGAR